MKTKQEYIIELTEAIKKTKLQIEAIDKLLLVMKSLSGTNIRQRKRIQTKLQEALPDFSISFGEKYSWYAIIVYKSGQQILDINCGYQSETEYFDFDVITGIKERQSGGCLGNNYYFHYDKRYADCRADLINFEKQLKTIDKDYLAYFKLHQAIKDFNIPFLLIELRR